MSARAAVPFLLKRGEDVMTSTTVDPGAGSLPGPALADPSAGAASSALPPTTSGTSASSESADPAVVQRPTEPSSEESQ